MQQNLMLHVIVIMKNPDPLLSAPSQKPSPKPLNPEVYTHNPPAHKKVDDVVLVLDEALRPAACGLAASLRAAGRSVDIQLEPKKKVKAAIKAAERAGAARLLIVGGDEWARGAVAVRDLAAFEQREVAVGELLAGGGSGGGAGGAAAAEAAT